MMRIHTDELIHGDITAAAPNGTFAEVTAHESRSRHHAFEVKLRGHSARHTRAAGDNSGKRAATWSDWGRFLSRLFEMDPNIIAGQAYASYKAFHAATHGLFAPPFTPYVLADAVRRERATGSTYAEAVDTVAAAFDLPHYIVSAAIFGE